MKQYSTSKKNGKDGSDTIFYSYPKPKLGLNGGVCKNEQDA